MLLAICGFILGAIWGGVRAARRGGKAVDIAQYAFGHGVFLALAGVIATLVINRFFGG